LGGSDLLPLHCPWHAQAHYHAFHCLACTIPLSCLPLPGMLNPTIMPSMAIPLQPPPPENLNHTWHVALLKDSLIADMMPSCLVSHSSQIPHAADMKALKICVKEIPGLRPRQQDWQHCGLEDLALSAAWQRRTRGSKQAAEMAPRGISRPILGWPCPGKSGGIVPALVPLCSSSRQITNCQGKMACPLITQLHLSECQAPIQELVLARMCRRDLCTGACAQTCAMYIFGPAKRRHTLLSHSFFLLSLHL